MAQVMALLLQHRCGLLALPPLLTAEVQPPQANHAEALQDRSLRQFTCWAVEDAVLIAMPDRELEHPVPENCVRQAAKGPGGGRVIWP